MYVVAYTIGFTGATLSLALHDPAGWASAFLSSEGFNRVASSERQLATSPQDMYLALTPTWEDLGRCSRALEIVDRELRRCAEAWGEAYEKERGEQLFQDPDVFVRHLRRYPSPARTSAPLLPVIASASPLVVLVEPRDLVWGILAQWPLIAITYALASFAMPIELEVESHHAVVVESDDPSRILWSLKESAWRQTLLGQLGGSWTESCQDWRRGNFKPVGESLDGVGQRKAGMEALLLRTYGSGTQDVIRLRCGSWA